MSTNYTPNSNKFKEEQKAVEEKRVEKIVKGPVKTKKKNELRKFADVFISEDVTNVKSYVVMDVLIPAIKKAIVDIVTDGVHMIFYGGTRKGKDTRYDRPSYVDYSKRNYDDRRPTAQETRTSYNTDDFTFETRGEAEGVLAQMDALIERYGMVRVLDFYDMLGKSCDHTANRYGWTSTRNAEVVRVRDGYVIRMSRAMPIE